VHRWTSKGYENDFLCTPWKRYTSPEPPRAARVDGIVPARVLDNNDPQGLGRLQVQYFWQEDNHTCWLRMMSPHSGADRGFMFLPEIGDEVWVMFEEGDPERARVLGSSWNGVLHPPREQFWGEDITPNDVKRIVTKSGHRITIVDKPGKNSMVLATPKHLKISLIENSDETGDAMLTLHSDGDIVLSAPNGRIHAHSKLFSREIGGATTAALDDASKLHWISVRLVRQPDLNPRPSWWPDAKPLPYSSEPYHAELTDGTPTGELNGEAGARFHSIPEGNCSFQFKEFYSEIDEFFQKHLG
jgi:uncharacterized protein involved in type VI secretion and phage assembly